MEIFSPELTAVCETGVTNKKKALEKVSRLISTKEDALKYHHILDSLQNRERIGNTAFGHGTAIPHARVSGLARPYCAVLSLKKPINFSSQEETLVDLIFGLLVPEDYNEEHLQLLAFISKNLRKEKFRQQLREAKSSEALYQQLVHPHE